MERLTDEMLARLKELLAADYDPNGKWSVYDDGLYVRVFAAGGENVCNCGRSSWPGVSDLANLIVESRNALPILIAEIERLREKVKEYQEALKPFARPFISERDNDDLEVGFSGITIRDYRRAKALLEKEG